MLDELRAMALVGTGSSERLATLRAQLTDWFAQFQRLVPAADRRIVLNPPRLVARFAKYALRRSRGRDGAATADDVRARDPALVTLICDLFRILGEHYFRVRFEGVDQLPRGPVLLVGNHSGGLLPSEAFFTGLAIHDRFGVDRAVYSLAHDFLFEDEVLRRYAGRRRVRSSSVIGVRSWRPRS